MRLLFVLLTLLSVIGVAAHTEAKTTTTDLSAVAMPDSYSADAAMAVLEDGGNAIDAAITAQFVLAVTLPEAGNVGGGGFMTIYHDGQTDFLDYRETAPAAAHRDMYLDEAGNVEFTASLFGALASGIPGTVDGMWRAHKKYGSLPWSRLLAPAVKLAKDGFVIHPKLADNVVEYIDYIGKKNVSVNFADYFGSLEPGMLFKQPELADTLQRISDNGRDGFYLGETSKLITTFMQQHKGLITAQDLAGYEAKWRRPIVTQWRGHQLVTAPPPSSGGIAITQWLGMMEHLFKTNPIAVHNSATYLHLVAEAGKRVFADRAEYLGDPDFIEVPVGPLTNPDYVASRAEQINLFAISDTPSIKPGLHESEDTTHFSIIDKWGNAVANTTTINLTFGSGMVVNGAGFLLNDEMDDFSAKPGVPNFFGAIGGEANAIAPGKRMLSSMTPTIVLKGAKPVLVTGSPGGTTIISSVTQSILNALVYDMPVDEVVNTPRFHHQLWPKDTIRFHPGLKPEVVAKLTAMGYVMDERRFGDLHVIKRENGIIKAASELSGRGKSIVSLID